MFNCGGYFFIANFKTMKLIILDRDGVINYESEHFIKSPSEWEPISGSLEAIAALKKAGYAITVATNQSGIARGLYTHAVLAKIHEKMAACLKRYGGSVDKIFYCPHSSEDNCSCRKPNVGLLKQISEYYNINLKHVPFIGDSLRDIQAAQQMQCQAILVRTGFGEKTLKQNPNLTNVKIYNDLADAVKDILSSTT